MSRRNLTSNKRSFRKNPRNFIDKVSDSPIEVTISDGVNPEYQIQIDPKLAKITKSTAPGGVNIGAERVFSPSTPYEEVESQ
ncbi:MAG: hypothetical protein Tp178MES00d2C33159091_40 [Prokaryotic dsDNA virus sp.]|nr:hypothetical protein [Thalassospira sp.]MAZ33880.1 hypothetical protein [Thalassospira sp.]MAZ34627.1 hypothetical protein [Thalassospira sp.]QDP60989.1 MAG: hypothetical protein Tp178MES00d2C33159091_40 [Prokaryotic dsDNA virus sp.]QDP64506.1 MAG: hypothetical protein Tp178SUR1139111_26 [Prokaryotic dsDNA virus sp.]|tara:strand:+ start:2400 stop:2645 length:246 start_codon:yes stop_codon:yes gene_type:complete